MHEEPEAPKDETVVGAGIETPPPIGDKPSRTRRATAKLGRLRPATQLYDTVESAAVKLATDANALRARLRRAQRLEGDAIVADLGGGIRAFKFGKNWRISVPTP